MSTGQTPPPRRVAVLLGSTTGGVGVHVRSLIGEIHAAGYDVRVLCPAAAAAQFDFAAAGARVTTVEIPASPGIRDTRVVADVRATLRDDPVSVLHAHGLRAGLVAALARPASVPLVVTWHNTVLGRGMRARVLRLGERFVARAARVTLAASTDLVERVSALGGRDVRLGPVATPLTPTPTRSAAAVRQEFGVADGPLIISVGRLHPQKDYPTLIDAAVRWRELRPTPLVIIAGTGPDYRELAASVLSRRAPIRFLGHRDDVADLLGAADLAVVTSGWEARQLFAQEALAAGVPLVCTTVGGLPELVGDAAVTFEPGDVDALDTAVRRLLADPDERGRLAAAGLARAATWPTPGDTADQVLGLYAELIDAATVSVDPVPRSADAATENAG